MRTLYKLLILSTLLFTNSFANDKVTLQLDWLHQFQFAGYYIAKEKGYYQEKNLDVVINQFDFSTNLLDHVLQNEASYSVGKSSLIIDKTAGSDIVALAAIYQHSPMVLLTRKDSNIHKPQDLYHKKVMLTPDARMAVAINSMISSQGVKLKNVNFIPHSFKLDDLINKKTDAMGSYLSNEPYLLKEKGIEFNILDPRDYGFDFYGGLLFTSQKELNQNPQRVRDFYDATLKGWHYAFNNIQETAQIILNKYNTQKKTLDSLIYEGKILKELSGIEKDQLGNISLKKYSEIQKIYSLLGYKHDLDVLNNFIYNPDSIILSSQEKEYLKENKIVYNTSQVPPFDITKDRGIEYEYLNLLKSIIPINIELTQNKQNTDTDFQLSLNNKSNLLTKKITAYSFAIATKSNINYIQSLHSLKDKQVAIVEDSFFDSNYKEKYPNISFVIVNNFEKAFDLLKQDKVYSVVGLVPLLLEKISAKPYQDIKISGISTVKHDMSFLVHKDNAILSSILNKAIDKINPQDVILINTTFMAPKKQVKK